MVPLSFAGEEWFLLESRALYWPRKRALLLADLHLEKASFYASHGQPLPPYDSRETLERVADAIRLTDAKRVITLGDNFHDRRGALRLEDHAAGMLGALTRMVDWTWITGNHDDGTDTVSMEASCGGTVLPEMELGGVVLRHIAKRGERRPEISGHFHPRLELSINRRKIRRPCVVVSKCEGEENSACRLVAPAFGSLTAGMPAGDPAIVRALQPASDIRALLIAKGRLLQFPLWRENNSRAA